MGLNDFQKKVFEMSSVTKGHSGFAAKSSIRYVERSFELAGTMPEVAAFLAITAEEEAATALFLALKSKGYLRSSELKMHDHKHKGGLYPFLTLLGVALELSEVPYQLVVDNNNGRDTLRTQMQIGDFVLQPDPPLNQVNVDASGDAKNYLHEVRAVASERGITSIFQYIKDIANKRNLLLYASATALPSVENVNAELQRHIGATILIHIIYLLVIQHSKQNLVEECVNVYLKIQHNLENKT
ncbi:AbiV family abortive infection protein [Vibrio crassostreae]|uniref:hypothetical protein n=1 Tax=Vibrio crassostreae TaxID=246167 RepID=UPI00148D8167|nr:hypothetical protein [Vibrio crassostreae]NOH76682.1 hypothetical protein [Vibrio crassostreae]CAK2424304.1 AbiV family abortive infection protein [Vibrio crassostreae]CAK2591371.1 AbiV family abortive infection protein [Vibrio crassostreae]CAK3211298.1 AbiV family abortive infection protein [Vibrio crassostreae]